MRRRIAVALALLVAAGACTDGKTPSAPGGGGGNPKGAHLRALGAVVQGGNPFYQVFVAQDQSAGIGQYTVMTGPQHPVTLSTGSAQNVIFGDGSPGTTFNTVRSYTSSTDYTQDFASPPSGFTDFVLDPTTPGVTAQVTAIGTTGYRTTYTLAGPPQTPDKLTIVQVVNVNGSTFANSTVEVTTTVTNNGSSPVDIGIRYEWDTQIGQDDGPTFTPRNPDASPVLTEAAYQPPSFAFYRLEDNDHNTPTPLFDVYGTVTGPTGVSPAPTPPDLLENASWAAADGTTFDYAVTPSMGVAGPTGIDDNAVLYYWGHDAASAIVLAAGASRTVSQSLVSGEVNTPPPFNQPPTATITAPANNATFASGTNVSFAGTGHDPEDGDLTGNSLTWTSSRDGVIGHGTSFSTTSLSVGVHTITLTAKDSQGATGTATITITITGSTTNTPPVVHITAPADSSTFTTGQSVHFTGTGSDTEDGTLSGGSLVWMSSRDGQIGTGTSFSTSTLSPGIHVITLTGTDSQHATGTASITIRVGYSQQVGSAGGSVCALGCHALLYVEPGATSSPMMFTVFPTWNPPANAGMIPHSAVDVGPTGTTFAAPIGIGLIYSPSDIPGTVSESSLRIYQLVGGSWVPVPGSGVNTVTHTAFASVTSLGTFAIIGTP